MKTYVVVFMSFLAFELYGQHEVEVNDMKFSYLVDRDSIYVTLRAPTLGWVGVGFNNQNNIVGSDLLLFHIIDGETEVLDMYVAGLGNPKEDERNGGEMSIRSIKGIEKNEFTQVTFSRAMDTADLYDFAHQKGKSFWLILAYSLHDNFSHHSRMRKHILLKL